MFHQGCVVNRTINNVKGCLINRHTQQIKLLCMFSNKFINFNVKYKNHQPCEIKDTDLSSWLNVTIVNINGVINKYELIKLW